MTKEAVMGDREDPHGRSKPVEASYFDVGEKSGY